MAQVNDLSRSLTAFDPISTLVVVVEMSEASWLVSGVVPGVERQPEAVATSFIGQCNPIDRPASTYRLATPPLDQSQKCRRIRL